jgi:hypothetical protein
MARSSLYLSFAWLVLGLAACSKDERPTPTVSAVATVSSVAAPVVDPAYRKDLEIFCDAAKGSGAGAIGPSLQHFMRAATWLDEHLTTAQGKDLLARIGTAQPILKSKLLRDEATKAGVVPCPFADDLATLLPKPLLGLKMAPAAPSTDAGK